MSLLDSFFSLLLKDRIIILILISIFILSCLIDFRKIEFDFVKKVETLIFAIIIVLLSFMLERENFKIMIILLPFFSIFLFSKYIDYDRYSLADRVNFFKIYMICMISFSLISFLLLKLYDLVHHIQKNI